MIRRGLSSVAGTWLAGLLVTLPLVVTLAILAWAFDFVRGLVGPGTSVAQAFAALGYPFTQNPRLATLVGVLVMLGAIYVIGLTAKSRLIQPLRAFVDRTIKRIPLVGNVYELADRFVGVLGPKSGTDLAAMRPVWCFFGGDGVAVLALVAVVRAGGHRRARLLRGGDSDRAGADRRRAALRARRLDQAGADRHGQAHRDLRVDGHHAAGRFAARAGMTADARAGR